MTSSCNKLRRAMLCCLSRPADYAGWLHGELLPVEQKAPRSVSWRFTPKKLAKEIDESASVVVGDGMVSQIMFSRDKLLRAMLSCYSRPADCEGWSQGEV